MLKQSVDSSFLLNCPNNTGRWNYCATIETNLPASETAAAPASAHKLWLGGNPKKAYIPFIFGLAGGKIWGAPGKSGSDIGVGVSGAADSGSTIGLSFSAEVMPALAYLDVPGGVYEADFTMSVYSTNDRNMKDADLCDSSYWPQVGKQTKSFTVQAMATSSCHTRIARNIAFPVSMDLQNIAPQSGEVDVSCTRGTHFEIGWDAGRNPQNNRRGMKCADSKTCGANVVYYDLFKDQAGNAVWGRNWGDKSSTYEGTGGYRPYPVWGRVYADQPEPPRGKYRDTVIATIMIMAIDPD